MLSSSGPLACCFIFEKRRAVNTSTLLLTRLPRCTDIALVEYIHKFHKQIIDEIVPSKFVLFLKDCCTFNIVRVFYEKTQTTARSSLPTTHKAGFGPTLCNVSMGSTCWLCVARCISGSLDFTRRTHQSSAFSFRKAMASS